MVSDSEHPVTVGSCDNRVLNSHSFMYLHNRGRDSTYSRRSSVPCIHHLCRRILEAQTRRPALEPISHPVGVDGSRIHFCRSRACCRLRALWALRSCLPAPIHHTITLHTIMSQLLPIIPSHCAQSCHSSSYPSYHYIAHNHVRSSHFSSSHALKQVPHPLLLTALLMELPIFEKLCRRNG